MEAVADHIVHRDPAASMVAGNHLDTVAVAAAKERHRVAAGHTSAAEVELGMAAAVAGMYHMDCHLRQVVVVVDTVVASGSAVEEAAALRQFHLQLE